MCLAPVASTARSEIAASAPMLTTQSMYSTAILPNARTNFPISYGAPDLNPFTLLNDIVSNNWSTLEVLFDGAFNCTLAGGYGQPLNFLIGDELYSSCMSQLQMCSLWGSVTGRIGE